MAWRGRVPITIVAAILGVLVVAQLRTQALGSNLNQQSAQDLTLLIANLNTQNEQLRAEVADLEQQADALATSRARGEGAAGQLRGDLDRIQAWAGLLPVVGQGVSVRVTGPIAGEAVEDLINELRNAGAEGIAVEGVRVVPGIVVAGAPGAISVENTVLGASFEIRAIGSSQILTGSLTRAGGIISQLSVSSPEATISVTPLDAVQLPATDRDLIPSHGQPSL